MILIDPELSPSRAADALNPVSARRSAAAQSPKSLRLPSTRTLARFLSTAQSAVQLRGQVTVLLTSDAAICDLNRRFRHKNKPTDVLSFPSTNPASGPEKIAGDVAISVETALRQAAEQGHALTTELKVLILHGLLHLAGYDHEADTGKMQRRERSLRERLGLPQGLIERSRTEPESSPKSRPTEGAASRTEARKLAPDGVRRGTRRTQSGEGTPGARKPRRGEGSKPAPSTRSARS